MLDKKDIEEIKKEMEIEFPNDFALQQIHIAKKIIAKEAEIKGLSYFDYIKLIIKDMEAVE